MNKNKWIIAVAVVVLVILAWFFIAKQPASAPTTDTATTSIAISGEFGN